MLRSLRFDLLFVLGSALAALLTGLVLVVRPDWFGPVLLADVWLLGSQHVIATYTRIGFDRESFQRHRFLVLGLPWIVAGGVALAICTTGGTLVITTVYLYWQWLHYTGQSHAVQRLYASKAEPHCRADLLTALAMFGVPLWGLLYRFWQKRLHPDQAFLTFDFWAPPVPGWMVDACGWLALGLVGLWLARGRGRSIPLTTYVVSHWLVFLVGYRLIEDVTLGYLVLNVWHNVQYVLLVWMFNSDRFRAGVEPRASFLSFLSQPQFVWAYFTVSIACAGVFYKLLAVLDGVLLTHLVPAAANLYLSPEFFRSAGLTRLNLLPSGAGAAAVAMLTYQAVNFHHYCVDAVVWSPQEVLYRPEGNRLRSSA